MKPRPPRRPPTSRETLPHGGTRVDKLVELALSLTPAERRALIETLIFFETVMATPLPER